MNLVLAYLAVFVIIMVVPVVVYGVAASVVGLDEPEEKRRFFLAVALQKAGTALGFTGLFHLATSELNELWLLYGTLWAVMFAIVEVGEAVQNRTRGIEVVAGVLSEFIYFPLAALACARLL